MAWATPEHDREAVNKAGRALLKGYDGLSSDLWAYFSSLGVINNWRASHAFPLNTFQMNLRRKAKALDDESLTAQRIKRLSSIHHKLDRFDKMKLSQMQDIGGCRAIVRDVPTVRRLVADFQSSAIKHKQSSYDDYITTPKSSGYRGIHLVYRYFSDRKQTYNDLKIEIQIRSQLQHSWATAVEVVGTLIQQALKSSQGEDDWLRFFQLMSSAIAMEEQCQITPNTPQDNHDLRQEIKAYVKGLRPIDRLNQYSKAIHVVEKSANKARYYLLDLRPSLNKLNVTGFTESDSKRASDAYLDVEKTLLADKGDEAVLVSVDSIDSLRKAYPNYFLDTTLFLAIVKRWSR